MEQRFRRGVGRSEVYLRSQVCQATEVELQMQSSLGDLGDPLPLCLHLSCGLGQQLVSPISNWEDLEL